jgi:hypothetical protein
MISKKGSRGELFLFLLSLLVTISSTTSTETLQTISTHITPRTSAMCDSTDLSFLNDLRTRYSDQPTFIQAVEEMALNILPFFKDPEEGEFYKRAFLMMAEPERTIKFRVPWEDDNGVLQFNRGYRVEFSR